MAVGQRNMDASLTQQAYMMLKQQIVEGTLPQGSIISISAIARVHAA